MVAHSEADGYTIFIVGPGMATNPFLYPSLSLAQPDVRAEFLTRQIGPGVHRGSATITAGKVTYASSGNGHHAASERANCSSAIARVEMTHIPYRGRRAGDQRSDPRPRRRLSSTTCRRSCRMCQAGHIARAQSL